MEGIPPDFVSILTSLGLPGLVIAALGWAYWSERKRNGDLNDKHVTTLLDIVKENAKQAEAGTQAIREVSSSVKDLTTVLLRTKPE